MNKEQFTEIIEKIRKSNELLDEVYEDIKLNIELDQITTGEMKEFLQNIKWIPETNAQILDILIERISYK
jgi:capsular polysaccharide biosynthesis protein